MTDLVTVAAIDALCRSVNDGDRYELESGLNAAAPLIAAEALRQAKQQVGRMNFGLSGARVHLWLDDLADELEGK